MKKMILLYAAFLLLSINSSFSTDKTIQKNEPLTIEQRKTSEAFQRYMRSAHPLPQSDIKETKHLIPLIQGGSLPIFLNSNMIEPETQSYQMQNESSIAVNPLNPKMLIGSSVDYRDSSSTWLYFSEDGAKTWQNFNLGKPFPKWRSTNDPSVAYDPDGYAYLVYGGFGYIDDTTHGVNFGENGVFISISSNGGKTWETENTHIPVILHKGQQTMDSSFEDKYYISIDNSPASPYYKDIYIPWKRVTPRDSATQIVISKSTDKGRTWSEPLPVSPRKSGTAEDTTYGQSFPLAATGPNGEVYVVWNDGIVHGVGFAKSYDGGKTFSEPGIVQYYDIFGVSNDISNKNDDEPIWRHTVKDTVRAEAYPVIVCDTTDSDRNGYLYLTWAADRFPNVYFARSTDQGETWSEPVIVHSDTTNDQFWQWLSIDPMNGDIAIMYLDSRNDPANIMVECYVSYSSNGGETWADKRTADISSDLKRNPFSKRFAGDYSGMAFYDGMIYPSWVDMRNAVTNIFDSDVFTAIISVNAPMPADDFIAKTIPEQAEIIELNWKAPTTKSFGQPISKEDYYYLLQKEDDDFIEINSANESYIDEGLNPYEKYHYKLYVVSGSDTSIFRGDSAYAGGARELAAAEIISAIGSETNEITFEIELPAYRDDKVTPLINLAKIALFDENDELLSEYNVMQDDTGKVKTFTYTPDNRGFYSFYVKAIDDNDPPNESPFSRQLTLFTGKIENQLIDNFDENKNRYLLVGDWNLINSFSFSSPSSLTDSPDGNYKKMVKSHLTLFPVICDSDNELFMELRHAAIIYKNDKAQIEISTDNAETWSIVATFNEKDYSYWTDDELNNEDWKLESILLPAIEGDTIYVRFNIISKLSGKRDGWYIDDITITNQPVGVKDILSNDMLSIYPNPASTIVTLHSTSIKEWGDIEIAIYSVLGSKMEDIGYSINNNEIIFNVSRLMQGIYFIRLSFEDRVITKKVIIK